MSLHTAVYGLARQSTDLSALVQDRIAAGSGEQGWSAPYCIFEVISAVRENTFAGARLVIGLVEATMYATTALQLDELEAAWENTFDRYSGNIGGEEIRAWIESSFDEELDTLKTDTQNRLYARVIETRVAFVPA